ncbi:hypothetical protein [Nibribacter koreensis]
MVWRCTQAGRVLEVVSTDFSTLPENPAGKSFLNLLNQTSKELATEWFQKFPAQTSLLPNMRLAQDPTGQVFTLGLTQTGKELWLFWSTVQPLLPPPPSLPGTVYTEDDQDSSHTHSGWEPEVQHEELLEELSRVNNELVNARRELIRQNIELHRLHRKQGESKTI